MSSKPYYTTREDELIRKYYPTATSEEMQRLLPNRTARGIRVRASKIGVTKNNDCWEVGKPFDGPILTHLSEAEKGYLAGIIDGEGCLRLSRSKNSRNGRPTYHIQVDISNTSRNLLNWLIEKLPGAAYYSEMGHNEPNWRKGYHWKIAGNRRAIAFLREIAPYLIIKREQAELLCNGYVLLSEEEREQLYQRLRELKHTQ